MKMKLNINEKHEKLNQYIE